eukprot:UN34236
MFIKFQKQILQIEITKDTVVRNPDQNTESNISPQLLDPKEFKNMKKKTYFFITTPIPGWIEMNEKTLVKAGPLYYLKITLIHYAHCSLNSHGRQIQSLLWDCIYQRWITNMGNHSDFFFGTKVTVKSFVEQYLYVLQYPSELETFNEWLQCVMGAKIKEDTE